MSSNGTPETMVTQLATPAWMVYLRSTAHTASLATIKSPPSCPTSAHAHAQRYESKRNRI